MKTIYKYRLETTGLQIVLMPAGAEILSAQLQDRAISFWAIVDSQAPLRQRCFEVLETGNSIPEGKRTYISTVQAGLWIWHIFERLE